MPTINVNGRKVQVDDSFLSLTPEQQDATVDEIAQSFSQQEAPQAPESQQSKDLRAELSGMTQNPAYARYEALPGWQKPIVAASDIGQLTAKGAMNMVGLSPEKLAATVRAPFTGNSYEDELSDQQRMTAGAQKRAGWAGTAAEIAGGAGTATGLARNGLTLMGRGATTASGLPGVVARTGALGLEGMGYGTANAYANDQNMLEGALYGLAGGAGGNLISEAATGLLSKAAGAFNKKPVTPSKDELIALKDAAYDAADRAGVVFTPNAVDRVQRRVIDNLTDMGYDPGLHPGATAALKRIQGLSGQNVTLKGLDTVRKVASNGFIPGNKSNNKAISEIISAIDDVTNKPGSGDVLFGNPNGVRALQDARKYASRVAKLETAENLIKRGNLQADRNITDTRVKSVKSQLAKINDPFSGWGRGYTAAEKEAAKKAATYTMPQRALHGLSVLNPVGGGKLSAGGHLAAAAANLATGNLAGLGLQLAGGLAGAGLGKTGEALANRSVKEFTDLIARGGVLAPTTKNAIQKLAESKRDALARGLLSYALVEAGREKAPAKQ